MYAMYVRWLQIKNYAVHFGRHATSFKLNLTILTDRVRDHEINTLLNRTILQQGQVLHDRIKV